MRGKVGLVIGLTVGYVLGTRAGRERYEQIKTQADKVWNTAPVQNQVEKVKDFATSSAAALPSTVWDTAVKVTKAAASKASTAGKADGDLQKAAKTSAKAVKDAVDDGEVTVEPRGGA